MAKGNMADYFIKFSFVVDLPTKAAQAYALDLSAKAEAHFNRDEPLPADFPVDFVADLEVSLEWSGFEEVEWGFETEKADDLGIWLHADYMGRGQYVACVFVQHLLRKFNPGDRVAFEWSRDCSRPRTDAYGGGAAVITAREIKTMRTSKWLSEQVSKNQQ